MIAAFTRSAAAPRRPAARLAGEGRYLIVPCEAEGCGDLAVIWDRAEEQVVDVIDASAGRYTDEDALWDEARDRAGEDWRAAA